MNSNPSGDTSTDTGVNAGNSASTSTSGSADVTSKVQGQMSLLERIAAFVPGFRGYKEKEIRRESDKLIRNHLYLKLYADKNDLRQISQKLADRRYFDVLVDLDRLLAKVDRVVEKVNHAPYGYSGFFDAVKVKEDSLDRMTDFDGKLIDYVNALTAEIGAFKTDLASGATSNLKARVESVTDKLEALEDTFDTRQEVINGVS